MAKCYIRETPATGSSGARFLPAWVTRPVGEKSEFSLKTGSKQETILDSLLRIVGK